MEYQSIALSDTDRQYLNDIEHTTKMVANMYGIPADKIQTYQRATWSNTEADEKEFQKRLPKIKCIYQKRLPRKTKKKLKKSGALIFGKHLLIIVQHVRSGNRH